MIKNETMCFDEQLLLNIKQEKNDETRSVLTSKDLCKFSDPSGSTLLHFAAEYGNVEITKYLLDSGANVNARDELGQTPLLLAVMCKGHQISSETIKILLAAKADLLKSDWCGEYPLQRLVDDPEFMVSGVITNVFEELRECCGNESYLMADILVGADCPLERAIFLGDPAVTEMMIEAGYSVNERSPCDGPTALHIAVALMDEPNVKILIRYGADTTAKLKNYYYPLSIYLIDDPHGDMHGLHKPNPRNPEILKILMRQYFNTAHESYDAIKAIYHLATFGDKKEVQYILQYDVDFSMKDEKGDTVLHNLVVNHNPNVAALFEGKCSDVNVRNKHGYTPLHYAITTSNPCIVRFLLEDGADVNALTPQGGTSLLYLFGMIFEYKRPRVEEAIEILLHHGADIQQIITEDQVIIFDLIINAQKFNVGKLLVSELVLREKLGQTTINSIRSKIDAHRQLKAHYYLCQIQLEDMKLVVVYGSITAYKLLMQSEENIVKRHAYNFELLEEFKNFGNKYCSKSNYYCNVLRNRIKSVLLKIKLVQDVTVIIFNRLIPELKCNYLVTREIISYLNYEDMKVLKKV